MKGGFDFYQIFIINSEGKEEKSLFYRLDLNLWPSFAPDVKKILFGFISAYTIRNTQKGVSSQEIWIMNVDGSGKKMITKDKEGYSTFSSFSPDGKQILFNLFTRGWRSIYIMNADGSEKKELYREKRKLFQHGRTFIWSPDGEKIVFVRIINDKGEIYIMNKNGSEQKKLTNNSYDNYINTKFW